MTIQKQILILGWDFNGIKDLQLERQEVKANNIHLLGVEHLTQLKENSKLAEILQNQNPTKNILLFTIITIDKPWNR